RIQSHGCAHGPEAYEPDTSLDASPHPNPLPESEGTRLPSPRSQGLSSSTSSSGHAREVALLLRVRQAGGAVPLRQGAVLREGAELALPYLSLEDDSDVRGSQVLG